MVHCLYCEYCLCMTVFQTALICPLMDLLMYVFVVDPRDIVVL